MKTKIFFSIALFIVHSKCDQHYCQKESCIVEKGVTIHWDLMGLDQEDPKLIQSIRDKVLWPPPPKKSKVNLDQPIGEEF